MKKSLLFLAIIASCFFISCGERKVSDVSVPDTVKAAFTAKYPGITDAKWESEIRDGKTIYGADFKVDGKKKEAEFDSEGNFLREK